MCIWMHEYPAEWPCPEAGKPSALYDHQPERRWRHWDTCQLQTILHAGPSHSRCAEHGARTVELPWADPGSRFTALFERLAMDWLLAASQQAVAERLKLRWEEVHAIQERAVKRPTAAPSRNRPHAWEWTKKRLHADNADNTISPS